MTNIKISGHRSPEPIKRSQSLSNIEAPKEVQKSSSLKRTQSSPELFKSEAPLKRQTLISPETISKAVEKAESLGAPKLKANNQKLNKGFWNKMGQKFEGTWLGKKIGFKASKVYEGGGGGLKLPDNFDLDSSRVPNPGKKMKFSSIVRNVQMTMTDNDGNETQMTTDIPKGSHAIVTKIPGKPGLSKVQLYNYKPGENGGDKTLELGAVGIVKSRKLGHFTQKRTHTKLPKDMAIFPHQPKATDIGQGAIGDCFLLAGLSAMVAKDPGKIENMIRDNGDGSVTVKMFDVVKDGKGKPALIDGKKQFKEKHITFEKSVLHTNFAIRMHAKDSKSVPWVALMEKAYTLHLGSYAVANEGGHASDVFEAFTGNESLKVGIKDTSNKSDAIFQAFNYDTHKHDPELVAEVGIFEQANQEQIQAFTSDPKSGLTEFKALLDNSGEVKIDGGVWSKITGSIKGPLNIESEAYKNPVVKAIKAELYNKSFGSTQEAKDLLVGVDPPLSEEVINAALSHIKPPVLSEKAKLAVLTKMLESKPFDTNGLPGSGQYNEMTSGLFDSISQHIQDGKTLGTGTLEKVGEVTGSGHSGGEEVSNGLVGGHDYAISGVVTLNHGDEGYPGPKDGPPLKFVKVVNPWGKHTGLDKVGNLLGIAPTGGFKYDWDQSTGQLQRRAVNQGESLVELSEFAKHFEDYYVN